MDPELEHDDFQVDEDEYTDTDLFDPESIERELEQLRRPGRHASSSARARIEEMIERKRLERELREFEDDDMDSDSDSDSDSDFDSTWV